MNAKRLVEHFERISETPGAVPRLRGFVLDLAMRGRLVEQDPRDQPVSGLLEQIEEQRRRLVESGTISEQRRTPPSDQHDIPFPAPTGWAWKRFADVAVIQSRLVSPKDYRDLPHIAPDNIESGTGRLLAYESVRDSGVHSSKHLFASGAILYSKIRPALAKVVIVDFDGLCSADMYPILPLIDRTFLHRYMLSTIFIEQSTKDDNRVAMPKINQAALSIVHVPLPPFAEQHRIVAKVDELMALCDRLEAAQAERESRRDRLVSASLQRLSQPAADPTAFRDHARFHLDHFARLVARVEHVAKLRQEILALAVRGRLVAHDPADECASMQLQRLRARASARQAPPRRRARDAVEAADTRIELALPAGWALARVRDLVSVLNGRAYSQSELLDAGTPVLRVGNLFTSKHWYYSDLELGEDKYCDKGDLIFAWSASFGPFIWGGPRVIFHYHIWKLALHDESQLSKEFLYRFLQYKTQEIKQAGHGISMVHMTKQKMEDIEVPLPPLAEQHRIVAKVDQLMAVCDQLETAITTAQTARRHLLEALLHEALQPAA